MRRSLDCRYDRGLFRATSTAAIYFVDEFAKSLETPLVVLGAVCDWRSPCY
ncbi:hypothetical protein [Microcoleus sp. PH2017_05_CCC_O_A]|uniref:hypothetical protein n=1 Tax=Microcoleus sp. PH2017_05_CCC_O_A TaxID=2798816 RepID=UPI001E191346|nr:hypothetical protein [Microcoleus sp. PH2017_05_CCC_O_A]MCC3434050.1 hypothetical protein [Microcoleus sp. PH2017_05_CCC_O_A]